MTKEIEDLLEAIDDIENGDDNIAMLEKGIEYFCGNYDICEGFKHALRKTIEDQYTNHADEQSPDDIIELKKILCLQ